MARQYDVALLDGGNLGRRFHAVHRQFHVRRPTDGKRVWTGVAFGYAHAAMKLRTKFGVERIVVCGDRGSKRRKAIYEGYKASRKTREWDDLENFLHQQKVAQWFLPFLGIPEAYCWGEEADDVLATLAAAASARGERVLVVTNDGDLLQLVSESVHVLQQKGETDRVVNPARLLREDGFTAEQLTHMMALTGDPGDDAPGVPGIGDKTAEEIVRRWPGFVPAALRGDASVVQRGDASTRVWNLLQKAVADPAAVLRAHALTKLYTDVNVTWTRVSRDPARLRRACEKLGFHSLLDRKTFDVLSGRTPARAEDD